MKIEIETFWDLVKKDGWQGYIWRISDADGPSIYHTGDLVHKNEGLTFQNRILEANMYHADDLISMHVKQIDDQIYAYKFELKNLILPDFKLSEEEVYPSSKAKLGLLKYRNLYTLKASEISCADFKSWIQVAQIFVGFKH